MSRIVGTESQRTYEEKLNNGFFTKYMSGKGLDIGYAGYTSNSQPILDSAIGIDVNYPGYNNCILPFDTESMDYVYSSHCIEHIPTPLVAIQDWHRVLKIGGFIVIVVPHQFLYEKKANLPSRFNGDHKRFYTPGKLLNEVEAALKPNTYRVRLLEDGDQGFTYHTPPEKHSGGQYEITLVIEKIKPPTWSIL